MSKTESSPLSQIAYYVTRMVNNHESYIIGRTLTIIDSVIVDKEQKKAVKDLIHEIFSSRTYHYDELEEMLGQFGDKYCPEIEKDYRFKLNRRKDVPHEEYKFN